MWPFKRATERPTSPVEETPGEVELRTNSSPLLSISNPAVAEYLGYAYPSYSGVSVNETTAVTLSAVYRACNIIAGILASMPLRSIRENSETGIRAIVPSFLDELAGPDSYTNFECVEQFVWHMLLHGEAFLMHRYNGAGALVGVTPVHPLSVGVYWDTTLPGDKRYEVSLDSGEQVTLDARTMTQIMCNSLDGLRGMSLITVARNSLGTAVSGDRTAARLFKNGALVSGMVTPEDDLSDDDAKAIKSDLRSKMLGQDNAGDIAVINRKLKFTQWSLSAADAQFLESRKFSIEEVARWFGVPPHLLMQTEKQTSWGTGVEEQNRGLRLFTFLPWAERIEARLSKLLPRTQKAEFDFTRLERSSPEDEAKTAVELVNAGLMTPNEARRQRGLPPLPGGDELRVPTKSQAPSTEQRFYELAQSMNGGQQ